jgi:hypothetical protein
MVVGPRQIRAPIEHMRANDWFPTERMHVVDRAFQV